MAGIEDKKEKLMKSYSDFLLKLEEEEKSIKELEKRHALLSASINDLSISMENAIEQINISLEDVKNMENNYKESNELRQDNKDFDSEMMDLANMDGDNCINKSIDINKSDECDKLEDEYASDSTEYFST